VFVLNKQSSRYSDNKQEPSSQVHKRINDGFTFSYFIIFMDSHCQRKPNLHHLYFLLKMNSALGHIYKRVLLTELSRCRDKERDANANRENCTGKFSVKFDALNFDQEQIAGVKSYFDQNGIINKMSNLILTYNLNSRQCLHLVFPRFKMAIRVPDSPIKLTSSHSNSSFSFPLNEIP